MTLEELTNRAHAKASNEVTKAIKAGYAAILKMYNSDHVDLFVSEDAEISLKAEKFISTYSEVSSIKKYKLMISAAKKCLVTYKSYNDVVSLLRKKWWEGTKQSMMKKYRELAYLPNTPYSVYSKAWEAVNAEV